MFLRPCQGHFPSTQARTEGGGGKACLTNFAKSSRILFQNIWWTVAQSLRVAINNAASTVSTNA